MKRILLRNVSVYARTRLLSSPCNNPSHKPQIVQLAASSRPRINFYSTEPPPHNKEFYNDEEDDANVSNEELKKKIEDFFGGNQEAVPDIFEAILLRELTGKHEETEKLMKEIGGKRQEEPPSDMDDEEIDESESDSDSDSDEFWNRDSDGEVEDDDSSEAVDTLVKDDK